MGIHRKIYTEGYKHMKEAEKVLYKMVKQKTVIKRYITHLIKLHQTQDDFCLSLRKSLEDYKNWIVINETVGIGNNNWVDSKKIKEIKESEFI
jgi:hypothetical protein